MSQTATYYHLVASSSEMCKLVEQSMRVVPERGSLGWLGAEAQRNIREGYYLCNLVSKTLQKARQ